MGSYYCRPKTQVLEDTNVAMYIDVGYSIVLGVNQIFSDFVILGSYSGLAYVKYGTLYHEGTFGSRFCCNYAKNAFQLSDVKRIEVVRGSIAMCKNTQNGRTNITSA